MTPPSKVVARRREPAGSAAEAGRSTGRLPQEVLTDQVRRLALFSAVAFAVWTVALAMDTIVLPALDGVPHARAIPIEMAAIAAAAAMWLCIRSRRTAPDTTLNVGAGFMLVNAAAIAALNAWALPPPRPDEMHLSWVAILILVFSMIAPGRPRRTFIVSLAAASADPAAFVVADLAGHPMPPPVALFVMCWPSYVCAAIATLPSRVLQRIGRRLREAQDMGSYHLIELLGTGGMGEVWRARHRLLARSAAFKLVRPEMLGARTDAEARLALRRFEREAQATAQLSSPHTIQLFDFGVTDEGTFYYVMELLTGRDLESLVREFGPVPASRAIYLLRQVCHSLADAHARGLVHRDIKPANIYVCRMGLEYDFVKVLDFGLVTFKRSAGRETLATLDLTATGTPAYMAPETILGDAPVDRRADVYALGCVAYFLLTGQLVFEADTPMKVLLQHLHTPPIPPSQRTELPIPRELEALVMACLEKDPDRRPQDAEQLFRLACECRGGDGWNSTLAHRWWQVHLPELTGPLTIAEPQSAQNVAAS